MRAFIESMSLQCLDGSILQSVLSTSWQNPIGNAPSRLRLRVPLLSVPSTRLRAGAEHEHEDRAGTIAFAWLTALLILFFCVSPTYAQYSKNLTHRAYMEHFCPTNDRYANTAIEHMKMAAASGYNTMMFDGPKTISITENWEQESFDSYAKVTAEAKRLGLEIVTQYFSALVGSNNEPGLGEVSPVRGTPLKVEGGVARCASDHVVEVKNGDFETFANGLPALWRSAGLHGSVSQDTVDKHGGQSSMKMTNIKANTYIFQRINLKPYRAYRIKAWFKTRNLSTTRNVEFVVTGKQEVLNRRWRCFDTPITKDWFSKDMDWKECVVDFNSMNNTYAKFAFWFATAGYGAGAQSGGTIWIDDIVVEEVGLYETMRRDDCPITVKSADGSVIYKEGGDYAVDPKLDTFSWEDCFYEGHLQIPKGSAIKEGQTLKVDWYKFADNYLLFSETNFCIPETWRAMEDDITRIDKLIGSSKRAFINFDEWRSAFQSDRCPMAPYAKTAGEYLAATMDRTLKTCRSIGNGNRELLLYNDMFDPYHNAINGYGMCVGGTANSWKGLDTNIVIVNWRGLDKSYAFFMGLDEKRKGIVNRQMVVLQAAEEVPDKVETITKLEDAGGRGVVGIMFLTWYNAWTQIPLIADAFKAAGWWGTGPLPDPGFSEPIPVSDAPGVTKQNASIPSLSLKACAGGRIEYNLPQQSRVDLRIVDMQGRTIEALTQKGKAGVNRIRWKTGKISAGVYFLSLQVEGQMAKVVRHVVM